MDGGDGARSQDEMVRSGRGVVRSDCGLVGERVTVGGTECGVVRIKRGLVGKHLRPVET